MPFRLHRRLVVGATLLSAAIAPAQAADFNVAVAARVVSFRQPAPVKLLTAAILFDPGDPESIAEAAAIEKRVGAGIDTGKTLIRVRRVPVSALGGLSGADVAFVTSSLRDHHQEIAAAAQKGGILTITSDLGCVVAARCAVAISSGSKMQITVNRAACKAARVQFGSAFLMLVKEL
ncbi:YfiR family protein [Sphingobium sufflavum]|uniref:YfiR/HmsC family protein n=1 Tax=Sphingobium sufflavum TaxID=1129547 RepID=UPI001F15F263|nr:YfiR/HmsC family protein [Sphingobium sufflavum]MCE7798832.1 YfiR family protein [Sphingobium sufflavum]